jgi:hypothetical protein
LFCPLLIFKKPSAGSGLVSGAANVVQKLSKKIVQKENNPARFAMTIVNYGMSIAGLIL